MKGLLALTAMLLGTAAAPLAHAQTAKVEHSKPKYDFALVRPTGSTASWGSWDWKEAEKFKARGPGLYVRKDGKTYVITDPQTIRKADAALEDFKKVSKKMGGDRRFKRDERRSKEMAARAKEQAELSRQMDEAAEEYSREARKGDNPEAEARFKAKMDDFHAKMKEFHKSRKGWDAEAFGKEMEEFGRQMEAAAKVAGDKITTYIDEAFAKGLARPL